MRLSVRESLDLEDDDLVIGIVARVQRKRRFDLLLAAMQRLAARQPRARLLIIGRGTHLEKVARLLKPGERWEMVFNQINRIYTIL